MVWEERANHTLPHPPAYHNRSAQPQDTQKDASHHGFMFNEIGVAVAIIGTLLTLFSLLVAVAECRRKRNKNRSNQLTPSGLESQTSTELGNLGK